MSGLEPGERIAQRYIVQGRLGSGGMATVYRCVDSLQQGSVVAVKLLHHHLLVDSPEVVARFRREAEVMSALSQRGVHPNVVALRDVILSHDVLAIVMGLVEGGHTLDGLLAEHGPLDEPAAVALMTAVLAGLEHVHACGVVHRDLKPSNILIERAPDGSLVPRVSDFGIAKWRERPDDPGLHADGGLTQTRSAFGSPAYMAPELFDSAAAASPSSDLYALGVVLYELLVGEPPFVVDSMPSHVMRVSTKPAPSPRLRRPELSGDIERVLAVALAKDPDDRFPSARAFADALAGHGSETLLGRAADPERIGRDYRVDRRIGRGPVATVYACTDESLGVPVALKVLRGNDAALRTRFLEEARAQAALHQGRPHRSIAAIRHIVSQDDLTALVVEHVEGLALDRYVAEARPDLPTVLRLFGEAADALARAHGMGILHRNLKPQNLLVTWSGSGAAARRRPRTKLCDFGMFGLDGSAPRELAYVAPEVQLGRPASPASDVYALGVLMLLALEGKLPAALPSGAAGARKLAAAIPEVPLAARELLARMLAAAPEARPAMTEVFAGINDALRGLTGEDVQSGALASDLLDLRELPAAEPPSGRRGLVLALAAVVLLGLGAAAWFLLGRGPEPSGASDAAVAAESRHPSPESSTPAADASDPPDAAISAVTTAPPEPPEPAFTDVSEEVGRFLSGQAEEVSGCLKSAFRHERAGELESASGELEVEIAVDAEGKVTAVEVLKDTLEIVELGPCMATRIEAWSFPASGRPEVWAKRWHF